MQLISASDAARLISSDLNVLVSGSGGGHGVPEAVLEAIEARFLSEKSPRDLTLIHVVGIGDRKKKGAAHFGHEGLLKRSIPSALVCSPVLSDMALANKIESYILPRGVMYDSILLASAMSERTGEQTSALGMLRLSSPSCPKCAAPFFFRSPIPTTWISVRSRGDFSLRKRASIASSTASGTPCPPPDPLTSTFASDDMSRAASDALINCIGLLPQGIG